ncbi:helix-turn-helix domain-containing protein [Sorangium sp. So ce375]|uniref:helix-turn-helix domain-containing protein n=1 Tax=Sorangium sp. So ce375 TaxID=3133306 RepID=UPI003F5BE03C
MTTERWASVEDVARHLGVAKDSVYRWIETRSLPAHKIGRLWKFQFSEVDEWVLDNVSEWPPFFEKLKTLDECARLIGAGKKVVLS